METGIGAVVFFVIIPAGIAAVFGVFQFSEKGESVLAKSVLTGIAAAAGCFLCGWAVQAWAGTVEGLIVGTAAFSCFTTVVCTGVILSRLDRK